MLNFVDNWLRPLQLTVAQVEAELDLPDGQYILTVADSETAATRWEILAAMDESGQAMLLRESAQEWGAGSVIYCSVNSAILAQIFLGQEALDSRVTNLEGAGLQQVYAAPTGSDVTLDPAMPYWATAPGAGLVTFSAPADMPGSKRLENTVEATLSAGGRVRIAGNGRDIIEALIQPHADISASLGPSNAYLELTASATARVRLTIAVRAGEYAGGVIRLQLAVDIVDLASYAQLS